MKLYIDTQIYRQYVNPASDTKPLEKLKKLIDEGKIELIFPSQTKKEFLKHFKKGFKDEKNKLTKAPKYNLPIAPIKKNKGQVNADDKKILEKIDSLNDDLKKYYEQKRKELESHYSKLELSLESIFKKATFIKDTDEVVLKAVIRYAKDLPPKKNDHKFGDAIIWETLKDNIRKEDLVIISKDGDFISKDSKKILSSEWKKHTGKDITFYPSIGELVNKIDPDKPISKQTIEKEKVRFEHSSAFNPVIVNNPLYGINIQGITGPLGPTGPMGPTGPTGPFEIHTASGFPSSIFSTVSLNNEPTLITPKYETIIPQSGILGISAYQTPIYTKRLCKVCHNELPDQLLTGATYCPVCGTFIL